MDADLDAIFIGGPKHLETHKVKGDCYRIGFTEGRFTETYLRMIGVDGLIIFVRSDPESVSEIVTSDPWTPARLLASTDDVPGVKRFRTWVVGEDKAGEVFLWQAKGVDGRVLTRVDYRCGKYTLLGIPLRVSYLPYARGKIILEYDVAS